MNLLFFLVLCLLPERSPQPSELGFRPSERSFLSRIIPNGAVGSAAAALLITVPIGFASAILGAQVLVNYGWGLFVALPFAMGFVAALLYGVPQPRSLKGCIGVACLSVSLLGLGFLALAVEGIICLVMAMPLALPLAILGGVCAYGVQRRPLSTEVPVILSALLLLAPGVEWMEHLAALPSSVYVVRSSIDVQAPPERVWKQVVAFSEFRRQTSGCFAPALRIPSERRCWALALVLSGTVYFQPDPLSNPLRSGRSAPFEIFCDCESGSDAGWTPYSRIEPPHLHGFLVSEGGQFLLTPLSNGGTRLEGTTGTSMACGLLTTGASGPMRLSIAFIEGIAAHSDRSKADFPDYVAWLFFSALIR